MYEYILEGSVGDEGLSVEGRNSLIHQVVALNEVECHLWQSPRVIDALPWSGFWNFVSIHWKPIGIHCGLLLLNGIDL